MENKDLIWRDYKIEWPSKDFIYFDQKMGINKLSLLANLLHADNVEIINITNNEDYGIYYHVNKKSLECWNCDLGLDYNEPVKVKLGGKTYA